MTPIELVLGYLGCQVLLLGLGCIITLPYHLLEASNPRTTYPQESRWRRYR